MDPIDPCPQRRFLFLIASARRGGNSEWLARRAASRLPASSEANWLRLAELRLPPFEDIRHQADGAYLYPGGAARIALEETLAATDLVFVVPLYWYSLPASAKLYLDHWSGWLRVSEAKFAARMAGKRMWAIGALSDEDFRRADPLLQSLRLSADYLDMVWGGSLLGYANRPGEISADANAIAGADLFFAEAVSSGFGLPATVPTA